jgi:SAM-dependent methyltransferase
VATRPRPHADTAVLGFHLAEGPTDGYGPHKVYAPLGIIAGMSDSGGQDSVVGFYNDLAATYDRIYADWPGSIARQAAALDALIRKELGSGAGRGLDCACGIGTQLIGLAALGYAMSGADLSPAAAARARQECRARGLVTDVQVADMRALPYGDGTFDVIVCADNSLPHLLTEGDVSQALGQMRRVARPGAVVLLSTRDYDSLGDDRPTTGPVQRSSSGGLRTVTTQLWDWRDESPLYDMTHLQVQELDSGRWVAASRTTTYRAWLRRELATLATETGLHAVRWVQPRDSHFFQPVMIARA